MRNSEDRGNTGGVVVRTIVDRVTVHGGTNAKMIVMRAVNHVLRRKLRICTSNNTDNIVGRHVRDAVREGHVHGYACCDWTEVARVGLLDELRKIQPGLLQKIRRHVMLDPSTHTDWRRRVGWARQQPVLSGVRANDNLPWISRLERGVNDEHPSRALTFGFLVLVCPAPVVCHCLATEQARLRCSRGWIIYENEQNLSLDIHRRVSVPPVLGRLRSVTHKNQLALCLAGGSH